MPPAPAPAPDNDTVPPANKGMLAAAGVCLVIPIIALMWVGTYAKDGPKLGAFPFFIWYQMMWVFITAALTYTAYLLVRKARPHRPMSGSHGADEEGPVL